MAITLPFSLTEFYDNANCQVRAGTFFLQDGRRAMRTRGGEIITSKVGSRLWMGSAEIIPLDHQNAAALDARMSVLLDPGGAFYVYDKRRPYPQNDPDGSISAGLTVNLMTVSGNRQDVTFSGLTFNLAAGDAFHFNYGASPVRRAYHRIVTRDGSNYQVTPPIRDGYVTPAPVTIVKPAFKAVIDPESVTPFTGAPGSKSSGYGFSFTQTFRY